MKRTMAWLLAMALLSGCCPAFALNSEEALEKVSSYLTEVYGYSVEEAAKFQAEVEQKNGKWLISYTHSEHPYATYTAIYDEAKDKVNDAVTPFYVGMKHGAYPGEGTVRIGLDRAREEGWFTNWNDDARQAMKTFMADWGVTPTTTLSEGLALGTIGAGNALHEYFVSCYGEEVNWTPSLQMWHDDEMAHYGLILSADLPVEEGIVSYKELAYGKNEVEMTRFIGEVPEALLPAFDHPKLADWTCLCGATIQNEGNQYGYGLAIFERNDERLLVALHHAVDENWWIAPVSKQALYTASRVYILPNGGTARNQFSIVYENSATEKETFEVNVGTADGGRLDVFISSYTRMDEASGNGVVMEYGDQTSVTSYQNHQKVGETQHFHGATRAMSMVDIRTFPTTPEACGEAEKHLIPRGYAMIRGVHLRQKTSSRSRDLGDYNPGVLVKVLGVEPGDPNSWYHVQVGSTEGYMSEVYVDEAATQDTAYALTHPLPVAQSRKTLKLKKNPSWLAGTVQEIPAGTRMHVLASCDDDWLHVSIPRGAVGWQMDVNGTDGYVKEEDVILAGTPLLLDWME